MSASLVGSEMCIRDRSMASRAPRRPAASGCSAGSAGVREAEEVYGAGRCLLYTSDAADDM
eukprot:5335319-Alexandrium_andersonii.AAC.1